MILEKTWEKLRKRMDDLKILETDLEEIFIQSSKKGGQHVNKTASCVYLKHQPTKIEVKCQVYRTQIENRYKARKILCDQIEQLLLGNQSPKQKKIQKIQKQKRKKTKRSSLKYQNIASS